MKRLRFMRPYLVAVCATGATVAMIAAAATPAQASELPQFGTCTKVSPEGKQYHGDFSNATCTKENPKKQGKYEGRAGLEEPAFTVTGGESSFGTRSGTQLTCKATSGEGQFGTPKQIAEVRLLLSGCERRHVPCTSGEAKEGEVTTSTLKGELGWISESQEKAGLELFTETGAPVLEAQCGGMPIRVQGSVVVAVKLGKEGSLTVTASSSKGVQKPERLEGGPVETLKLSTNGGPFEAAGLKASKLGFRAEKALNLNLKAEWKKVQGTPYFEQPDETDNRSVSLAYKILQGAPEEFSATAGEVRCGKASGEGKPASPGHHEATFTVKVKLSECTLISYASSATENPYTVEPVTAEYVYNANGALELPVPLVFKMPEMPGPLQQCTLTFIPQTLLPNFLENEGVWYHMQTKPEPFYLATEFLFRYAEFEWGQSCNTPEFNSFQNEGLLNSADLLEGPGPEGDQLEWHGS